jgi:hypothetical protein
VALGAVLLLPLPARAAGTPATTTTPNTASELINQQGSATITQDGDYISAVTANGGINQPYRFYVEVPPNLPRLVVDLFDPDVLAGANDAADERDRTLLTGTNAAPATPWPIPAARSGPRW